MSRILVGPKAIYEERTTRNGKPRRVVSCRFRSDALGEAVGTFNHSEAERRFHGARFTWIDAALIFGPGLVALAAYLAVCAWGWLRG